MQCVNVYYMYVLTRYASHVVYYVSINTHVPTSVEVTNVTRIYIAGVHIHVCTACRQSNNVQVLPTDPMISSMMASGRAWLLYKEDPAPSRVSTGPVKPCLPRTRWKPPEKKILATGRESFKSRLFRPMNITTSPTRRQNSNSTVVKTFCQNLAASGVDRDVYL